MARLLPALDSPDKVRTCVDFCTRPSARAPSPLRSDLLPIVGHGPKCIRLGCRPIRHLQEPSFCLWAIDAKVTGTADKNVEKRSQDRLRSSFHPSTLTLMKSILIALALPALALAAPFQSRALPHFQLKPLLGGASIQNGSTVALSDVRPCFGVFYLDSLTGVVS